MKTYFTNFIDSSRSIGTRPSHESPVLGAGSTKLEVTRRHGHKQRAGYSLQCKFVGPTSEARTTCPRSRLTFRRDAQIGLRPRLPRPNAPAGADSALRVETFNSNFLIYCNYTIA
ncbi:hypothetical protein EVAR_75498_1 [Eumeta japonica]|uniref:Uncharacterized protein n=1 Tax=Eumeta variegata TaxID=151549 RepID=A0A4C1TL45_EUMVA|nr:hypothetical protein EVAR_75498_1 [Eumeta japonica]